uniref:Uncharacterized protein n=1 Tax=Anopheles coluzzii TaxID=1518534 RepID=A0A8W7Q050_ANOCL
MNIQNATQTLLPHPYSADSNGLNHKSLIRRASSSFKHNASFVARLPTIRRHKSQSLHSPGNPKPPSGGSGRTGRCPRVTDINASSENLAGLELASVSSIPAGAGPLVATGNDLPIVAGRSFLSTGGGGGGGGHFGGGGGGPSSSRRSSFVSGIFSSAVQRRGSGHESAPHTTPLDRADRQEQPHRYRIVRFRTPFEALFRGRSASTAIAAAAAATVAASGSSHLPDQ